MSRNLRIAFLTPEYVTEPVYYGGLANYLFRVAQLLVKRGHQVEIFTHSDTNEDIRHENILVHRVRSRFGFFARNINRITRSKLKETLEIFVLSQSLKRRVLKRNRECRFDIIQASSYKATGLMFTFRCDIPLVVRVSSYEPFWRSLYKKRLSLDQRIVEKLELLVMRRSRAVYGPSELLASAIKNNEGIEVDVLYPPFSIEIDKLDTSSYEENLKGRKYLLFFGTIGLLKGGEVLAHSLPMILSRFPDMTFVFAGKIHWGPSGQTMLEYIMKCAGRYGRQIIHLGVIRHSQLYPIIQNSHAVVLPSLVDNTPNAMLEAMSFGKLVIGTRGASFEEFIIDGKSGILVEPGNVDQLRGAMETVWNMGEKELEEIGRAARDRILRLNPNVMCACLEEYYRKIIDSRLNSADVQVFNSGGKNGAIVKYSAEAKRKT